MILALGRGKAVRMDGLAAERGVQCRKKSKPTHCRERVRRTQVPSMVVHAELADVALVPTTVAYIPGQSCLDLVLRSLLLVAITNNIAFAAGTAYFLLGRTREKWLFECLPIRWRMY